MVHSSTASPMKTTPSALPPLSLSSTTPPPVPTCEERTDQNLNQIPTDSITTDFISGSGTTQLSTASLDSDKPPVVSTEKEVSTHHKQTPSQSHVPVNGRTSGRKRTPKACDCCGPNSAGHNVKIPSRVKRGRGRPRKDGTDYVQTPVGKMGHYTYIQNFDLSKDNVKNDGKKQTWGTSQKTFASTPASVVSPESPLRNCFPPATGLAANKEDVLMSHPEAAGGAEREGGSRHVVDTSLSTARWGELAIRSEMRKEAMSKAIINVQTAMGGGGRTAISSKMGILAQAVMALESEENQDFQTHHGDQSETSPAQDPVVNGDTVSLSDSDGEMEENYIILNESPDELQSASLEQRLESSQDLDPDMQVDQNSVGTDQEYLLVTLSNGNIATVTSFNHTSTPIEVEAFHTAEDDAQELTPIIQYCHALTDHRLYCHPETWAPDKTAENTNQTGENQMDAETEREESLEELTDAIHDFLESFYIKYGSFSPLTESDVLEHLKKKGSCDLSNSGLDIKSEMMRYRAGLASAPVAGFMLMHNKHTLSLEDLGTLEEQNWLNDQIINMYGELIMEATEHKVHFFNSFFHKQLVAKGYDGVKRWTKKVDLFSKWLLLIPIHLEIHWSLVTVTMATKTISYYDSQGIVFRHTTDNIMKYLLSEAREKKQLAFQKGWKITIIKGIPQQKNDSDCGVFVLEYCRRLSVKQPLLFSQDDMPSIRKRIYKELCDCRLND